MCVATSHTSLSIANIDQHKYYKTHALFIFSFSVATDSIRPPSLALQLHKIITGTLPIVGLCEISNLIRARNYAYRVNRSGNHIIFCFFRTSVK